MNLENIHRIYFLGIGGIGMSALARYFLYQGKEVFGYDRVETKLTQKLVNEGAEITYQEDEKEVPSNIDIVVYTPAISNDSPIYRAFKDKVPILKRAQMLGLISENSFSIGIAGTHGKTTTSCILTHILKSSEKDCSAFLGGIATNYNSNAVFADSGNNMVLEADEFDRSFLHLKPQIGLITSTDADHLDIYGSAVELENSFNDYIKKITENGTLVYKEGLQLEIPDNIKSYSYAIDKEADAVASDIRIIDGLYVFDLRFKEQTITNIKFGLAGRHNVENALGAATVALEMGVQPEELKSALNSFNGIKRRFEKIYSSDDVVYIDDYAHHPTEIAACVESAKELYPNKKITGVFQPHLYSRTRDFENEFAQSLSLLNEVILLEIYAAREEPIAGVSSSMLLRKIKVEGAKVVQANELVNELENRKIQVLLTMGAGDIDRLVNPIKNALLEGRILN